MYGQVIYNCYIRRYQFVPKTMNLIPYRNGLCIIFAKAIETHDWPDRGLLTRVSRGMATMYCGPRSGAKEGTDLFANNKSTGVVGSLAHTKLKAAFAKDHRGVPDYEGVMVPHLIRPVHQAGNQCRGAMQPHRQCQLPLRYGAASQRPTHPRRPVAASCGSAAT